MPEKNQPQNLPEEWKRVKLGEIGEFKTSGVDKKIKEKEKIVNLVNYMDVYKNHFITKNLDFMKVSANLHQIRSNSVRKGDILFTPSSETPEDIGHSAVIVDDLNDTLYSYHLVRFRLKNQSVMDLKFRGYIFNSYQVLHQFESLATGVTRFTLSKKDFESVYVIFPRNIKEQQKIAEILETVDNAVEKTDKIIEKYKRIKQGLMQDLLTKGIDENGNIRNPKTHKFKDSPLGKIPEEWEVVRLGDKRIIDLITDGSHYSPKEVSESNYLIANIENIRNGKIDINSCKKISKEDFKLLEKNNCKPIHNDVLFTKDGTIGLSLVYEEKNVNLVLLSSIAIIRPKEYQLNSYFLKHVLSSQIVKRQIYILGGGSALKRIVLKDLKKFQIPLPPLSEQKRIAEVLFQIDQTIEKETAYKEKLQHIKKGLMEDLLTGKVRVIANF